MWTAKNGAVKRTLQDKKIEFEVPQLPMTIQCIGFIFERTGDRTREGLVKRFETLQSRPANRTGNLNDRNCDHISDGLLSWTL